MYLDNLTVTRGYDDTNGGHIVLMDLSDSIRLYCSALLCVVTEL